MLNLFIIQNIYIEKNTYKNSSGKFKVRLPRTSSPNFKYPINPVSIIKLVTITIPTFNTPNTVENCLGFFISCSKGKTYETSIGTKIILIEFVSTKLTKLIPSNAKILVPKYKGIVVQ